MRKRPESRTDRAQKRASPGYKPLADRARAAELEDQLEWYRLIHLGRLLGEKARSYLRQAKGWSFYASHAGHDGIQLALGLAFRPNKDHLFPYYRDLLTCLAAGITPFELILNGLAKSVDVASGGRDMSNHFAKISIGIWNVSNVTGNHTQHAVGLARAVKYYDSDSVVYCSLGESACSEGYVFEALNGASQERLPVVFVVQNNGYGISVPVSEQTANSIVSENYRGLNNLTIINCDGTNPFNSMLAMRQATTIVHAKEGPVLLHAFCERLDAHSNSDRHELYRSEEDLAEVRTYDPYERLRLHLLNVEGVTEGTLHAIEEKNTAIVAESGEKAEASPDPDPSTATMFVLPEEPEVAPEAMIAAEGGVLLTLREAINGTLKSEFRRNPNTFLWGQDVASKEKGGVFNVTKGMQSEFGPSRVFNAPLAEDFIVGTANGFCRFSDDIWVVIEAAQFADYLWCAMEQVVAASHAFYTSNGRFAPNIVARLASGGYIMGGPDHSQTLEATLSTIPGLRIVVPAFADDAVGLLRHAMRTRGMTFFIEPKYLYNQVFAKAPNPGEHYETPFGKARIRREGKDLTIVCYGTAVHWCLRAASQLKDEHGVEAEVIDLRSLVPLDIDGILNSVHKTSKVMVVHEDKVFGGFGGEIASQIADRCFWSLEAPIIRVGAENCPVPFSRALERSVLPQVEDIYQKALSLVRESGLVSRAAEPTSQVVGYPTTTSHVSPENENLSDVVGLYETKLREAQSVIEATKVDRLLSEAHAYRELMEALMDQDWLGLELLVRLMSIPPVTVTGLASAAGMKVDSVAALLARLVELGAVRLQSDGFACSDRGAYVVRNIETSIGLRLQEFTK
jgi:2-oxoisovalerate dehydrogenase E1 component